MANNKKNNNKKNYNNGGWGMRKFSFWTIGAICILQLTIMVLSLLNLSDFNGILGALKSLAMILALIIPAMVAWDYVKNKQTVWKVLYFIFLLVLLITIIIPTLKGWIF